MGRWLDFRIDRFKARPWAGVRELLAIIQQDKRTRLMAVITGRPAGKISAMLELPEPVEVWGSAWRGAAVPDGKRELQEAPPEAPRSWMNYASSSAAMPWRAVRGQAKRSRDALARASPRQGDAD